MGRTTFDEPVVIYLLEEQGRRCRTEVRNTRACVMMTQHGLGHCNLDRGIWAMTFSLLTRAALDPTPQNLRMAQIPLEVLAFETAPRH